MRIRIPERHKMLSIDDLLKAYKRTTQASRHYLSQALDNSALNLCLTRIAETAVKAKGETAPNPPRVRMPYAD